MPELNDVSLRAFRDELRKEAAGFSDLVLRAAPRLRAAGGLGGAGGLVGAVGGAGLGAVHKYQEAKEDGAGTAGAALSALGGAGRGALRGAGLGAAAGLGAGAFTGHGASLAGASNALGGAARFGQRQVHALTGVLSPRELEAVGGGAANARKALSNLRMEAAMKPGVDFTAKLRRAEKGLQASQHAQAMGLTSIPGYLGAVRDEGLGKVLATGAKDQYYNTPKMLTALMVGMPAASAAQTLMSRESSSGEGKGEQLGANIGNVVGSVAGSAMPLVGNVAVGGALGQAGRRVGRLVDRARGRPAQPMMPAPAGRMSSLEPGGDGQHLPGERIMSPAAAGQQPEVGL